MAPNAEDCKRGLRKGWYEGSRVLPADRATCAGGGAWAGHDRDDSAERSRLLSPAPVHKPRQSRLQAGLTLGVWDTKKLSKYSPPHDLEKSAPKTAAQKRRTKILDALRPPYFILTMIAVIVCIHTWNSSELRMRLDWWPGAWPREPWRLLTYGLLHAGAGHLVLNSLVGLAVGWIVEREQGGWRVCAVWVGGVAGGALGAGAFQPHVRVVGASAGVYALLTSHLANVVLRFGHIPLWWFRPLSVVVLAASEFLWTLLHAPATAPGPAAGQIGAEGQVAWSAHLVGAAVGVPLAFLMFTGENSSKVHVSVCRVVSAAIMATGVAGASWYYCEGAAAVAYRLMPHN